MPPSELSCDGDERGAHRRRPHDAAVQHVGECEVLHVDVPAGALRGDVGSEEWFSDRDVLRRRDERRVAIDFQREEAIANQRPDADARAARARTNLAIGDGEVGNGAIQPGRAHLQQRSARGRRGRLNFDTAAHEPRAAAGPALIRTGCGVALDNGHA